MRAYNALYRRQHHDELMAKEAAYREAHKEQRRVYDMGRDREANRLRVERWEAQHPERARKNHLQAQHALRARKAGVATISIDRDAIFERDGGICGICRTPVPKAEMSIDHIVAISKGGPNLPGNVQLAHLRCNKAKRDRH